MNAYPDILGYITSGTRTTVNRVQVALAVVPSTVRAGRPFQAILLAQNTTSVPVDLEATLSLPPRDANKQKGRLTAVKDALQVRLRPGEVGYLLLPIRSHPQLAPGTDYKLGAAVTARPLSKPDSVRDEAGGAPLIPDQMGEKQRANLDKLRQLEFSASRRFGLGDVLEASFKVISSTPQTTAPPAPGWHSLWSLSEDGTLAQLWQRYGTVIEEHVFPRLKKDQMYPPLSAATSQHFRAAGYPLKPQEALFITKLLTLVVHMTDPGEDNRDPLGSQRFNMRALFKHELPEKPPVPRWFEGLLRAIAHNEQAITRPAALICDQLYDQLVGDTLPFAFDIIHSATGEDLGTPEEIEAYTENYARLLNQPDGMDFGHVYLPLVMGGVIVFDRVIAPDEKLEDSLREMSTVLQERDPEWTEDNDLVFLLTKELVNRSLRLFGFQI
jgi:hypothetical protein